MSENDKLFREDMLEIFLFETTQLVEQLEELLIEIEQAQTLDEVAVNEIFRIMHTIKGSSAMMMYDEISKLAHSLESAFDVLRNDKTIKVDCHILTDIVLQTADFIKSEIQKIQSGEDSDGNCKEIILAIENFENDGFINNNNDDIDKKEKKKEKAIVTVVKEEVEAVEKENKSNTHFYKANVKFSEDCQMENMRAYTMIFQMEHLYKEIQYIPGNILDDESTSEEIKKNGFYIEFSSIESQESLLEQLGQTMFLEKIDLTEVRKEELEILFKESSRLANPESTGNEIFEEDNKVDSDEVKEVKKDGTAKVGHVKQSLISVNVKKMDLLMDLVGELVIAEAMVTSNPELKDMELDNFEKASRQLSKLTNELQDVVMSMRLIPIAGTFQKMQRLIRDMKRKLNKEVDLEIIGQETEVDKNIAELISDPLMHIVRNALDHGIEESDVRIDSGKSATGKVVLEAKNAGGDIWITIKDDGKGLDKDQILKKAKQKGLLTKPEEDYSEKEAFSLILLPGFSTKENVSEFSGRGVGMDVVRENISKLGGNISIESKLGFGTIMRIRIPMTLAIIDGMVIGISDNRYIMPTTTIRESFRAEKKQLLQDADGNEMIMIRGNCYRVLRLHEQLKVNSTYSDLTKGIIIVVEDDDEVICLFADELLGKQQVVVKPIPKYIKKAECLAGCTILGDGSISLILDAKGLIGT